MNQQQRDGTGALFRNSEPRGEQSPTYTGVVVAGNVEYRVAGWVKTSSKTGEKYLSLALTPRDAVKPQRTYTQRRDDLGDALF